MENIDKGAPKTLYEKLWNSHIVRRNEDESVLLYIDRHLVHEVTSPQAFAGMRLNKRSIWRRQSILAVPEHNVPTDNRLEIIDLMSRQQVETLDKNCQDFGVNQIKMLDVRQGIVHVIGPEQGLTLPGMTLVCGDSHTSTHGAFACLAFGIGTTEIEHVLATQCLVARRAKTMRINVEGTLKRGTTAKDIILTIIGRIGTAGGVGHVIEYAGDTIASLGMSGRMTICNMSIEAGAGAGMIAVDDKTIEYVKGRPLAPTAIQWQQALDYWKTLKSDVGAKFDRELNLLASDIKPQVSWGTSPEMVVGVDECIPNPNYETNDVRRANIKRALDYMDLQADMPVTDIRLDKIFIGSCTNSRIEDLRLAAAVVKGKKISPSIKQALVVPGSGLVRQQAQAEGLDKIFIEAGFQWRYAGCSMCLGMNEDKLKAKERCASTSNRNFEGRQGYQSRTHLVSPAMAAAAAIHGHFVDVSSF